jgi:hypothetical protein
VLRRVLIVTLALGALSAAPAHASSFCGIPAQQDRAPELFGGPQIHTAYVHAADVADRFTTYADAIETNGEAIEAWWRGQDPTRAPRFDQFAFPCGPQLDLANVQLQQTGGELADQTSAFGAIAGALQPLGLLTSEDDVVVYYDGPAANQNLCGLGGGGLALVFIDSCAGIDSARAAAHELGHALGAVPSSAPHVCPAAGTPATTRTTSCTPTSTGRSRARSSTRGTTTGMPTRAPGGTSRTRRSSSTCRSRCT